MSSGIDYLKLKDGAIINTKYSIISDDNKSQIIFLRGKGKIRPIESKKTYESDIENLKISFKREFYSQIRRMKLYDDNLLVTLDVSSKGIGYNKFSFIKYDIFIKPLNTINRNDVDKNLSELINIINSSLLISIDNKFELKLK